MLEEEIISEDEDEGALSASSAALELKKLQFQENERVRENALHMKKLELKEKELAMQMKLKELLRPSCPQSQLVDPQDLTSASMFASFPHFESGK